MTVKRDLNGVFRTADFPRAAEAAPFIRRLGLLAVDEALAEEAKLVIDPVADGREVEGRERIHETGREAAETAIAEPEVGAFLDDVFEVLPHLGEGDAARVEDLEIDEIVDEETAHQVLEREVVGALHIPVLAGAAGLVGALEDAAADGQGDGSPPVVAGRRLGSVGLVADEVVEDVAFEALDFAAFLFGRFHRVWGVSFGSRTNVQSLDKGVLGNCNCFSGRKFCHVPVEVKAGLVPFAGEICISAELPGLVEHLAHFKVPRAFEFIDELPKTATGKIQKFALPGGRAKPEGPTQCFAGFAVPSMMRSVQAMPMAERMKTA